MNSRWACWFLVACMVAVAFSPAMTHAEDAESSPLDGFFQRFKEKRAAIERVEVEFRQTNFYPEGIEEGRGYAIYEKPGHLLMRYSEPDMAYYIDEAKVYEYDAAVEQVLVAGLEEAPDARAFVAAFSGDPERLRELYRLATFRSEGEEAAPILGGNGLRLEPKGPPESAPFQKAYLHLRDEDMLPDRITIQRSNETTVVLDFHNYRVNPESYQHPRKITLPEGVRIVENEEVIEIAGPEGTTLPLDDHLDSSQNVADAPEASPQGSESGGASAGQRP